MSAPSRPAASPMWAKVIDHHSCIGCHACSTACKSENDVPLSVQRTYVKYVDVGRFPLVRRAFQVTRCNQCQDAPCVTACPTSAMFARPDGIVDFDKRACIGCRACIAACPYDAIFINPADHCAEKCNFCAHRLEMGLEPACVTVCPTQAILVGDLRAPDSRVAGIVQRDVVHVRRPEKGTRPKVFYRGAHTATLDPLAAARPGGGLFLWSEQVAGPGYVVAGHPGRPASAAEAVVAYDVPHRVAWDWRVGLYTWTKSIAAGAYLVPALLVLTGALPAGAELFQWTGPGVALLALVVTGAVLIADLEHPARFPFIFTRAQGRSWLVKGAWVLTAYGALLAAHLATSWAGWDDWTRGLLAVGVALAGLTAIYTAWLFAQAAARDLWQSPLLPPHLLVQAALAGAAVLAPVAGRAQPVLLLTLALAAWTHAALVAGECTLPHATEHGRLAVRELVVGRFARWFVAGLALLLPALAAPWAGPVAAPLALAALLCFEHAYVQAGQAVPLA